MNLYLQTGQYYSNDEYIIHYDTDNDLVTIQNKDNLYLNFDGENIYFENSNITHFTYKNYYLFIDNWYLIVNIKNQLKIKYINNEMLTNLNQTYFIYKDPYNVLFDILDKNPNNDINVLYEYINHTFYFIVDQYYNNIFLLAADKGLIDIIEYYLFLGLNINYSNKYGKTALLYATSENYLDLIKLLLHYKANGDIQDNDGNTPLIIASNLNYIDIMELLLSYNVNTNIRNNDDGTALIIASRNNNLEAVKLLLEHNAKINMQDNNGDTALIISCANNNVDIVNMLLQYSANIYIKNNNYETALNIIYKYGYIKLIELFNMLNF